MNSEPSNQSNSDCDWELFDCEAYVASNYGEISAPDLSIVELLLQVHAQVPNGGSMIEIGVGPNLYPIMVASAHRERIHVTDYSLRNLAYVEQHLSADRWLAPWNHWATVIESLDGTHSHLGGGPVAVRTICEFDQVSLYDLGEAIYDFSSMHFVAESITSDYDELIKGCRNSVRCLRPGGSFVASFMLKSEGYTTAASKFPAVNVDVDTIHQIMRPYCRTLDYVLLADPEHAVREGHRGMMLVYGTR